MDKSEMNRREFQRLTSAAIGGMLVGAAGLKSSLFAEDKSPLLSDTHVCRGLNMCKGKGADKTNACAGQGACATAEKHGCKGDNACKGQGGCGAHPGENACKSMGACAVPLKDQAWAKARKRFEEVMKAEGKTVGPAPAKKG
jgi:hypothetical protein